MNPKDTKGVVIIVLLTGLLLVSPYFIRIWQGNPYNINSETYYNLRLYNTLDKGFYDNLQGRNVPVNILYFLPLTQNYGFLMTKIVVFFLALISVVLTYLTMKKHNISEKVIMSTTLLLVASPIFINTFIDFNFYAVTTFLSLLSIYLLSHNKRIPAALITAIIPFIDIYSAIIIVLLQAVYIISKNNTLKKHTTFLIISIVAIIASIALNYHLGYDVFGKISFAKTNIISDIGATVGFSFSSLLLAIIGLVLLWERNWKNISIYIMIIIMMILSVFMDILRIYLNLLIVIYAGFAFVYLMKRKWSIAIIKRITILLIICSILFTSLVFITKLVKSSPDTNYVDALTFLNKQSNPGEVVLSSEDNGYLIQYYAERKSFIDQKSSVLDPKDLGIFENITVSRNLDRTESLLKNNSIKYIFVDQDLQQYLEEKEGLLFLINTSNKFTSVYKNSEVEIWLYSGN